MTEGEGGADAAELDKAHGAGAFDITISGQALQVGDPIVSGRQLLSVGGFEPAADHILIRILARGTELIGLDEEVNLRRSGPYAFQAFATDRSFNFTIDGRGFVWGAPSIAEETLRDITSLDDDKVFALERKNKPDLELDAGDVVMLDKGGIEHLRTRKGTITVYIDDVEKQIPRGKYTTEELLQILGVDPGYVLDVVNERGQLVWLNPGEKIRVKKGMRFISQAPSGGSS